MDHYVPRNSPGTPQFLIRGSEGVGWGVKVINTVFTVSYNGFAVFYSISRPLGCFFQDPNTIPKRFQNNPKTILNQSQSYPTTIPKQIQNDPETIPTRPPNVYRRRPTPSPIADPVVIFTQSGEAAGAPGQPGAVEPQRERGVFCVCVCFTAFVYALSWF